MFLYTQSPITASPTTLSPTSIPTRHPNANSFHYSPANSPGDSNTFSPTHSHHTTTSQVQSRLHNINQKKNIYNIIGTIVF